MVDILGFAISLATNMGIFVILSISLNLEYGFAGLPNFGKVAFYGLGAFAAAWVSSLLIVFSGVSLPLIGSPLATTLRTNLAIANPALNSGLFVLAMFVGGALAGALGFLFSFPSIRLRGDFLAMTLLVFAEIFRNIIRNFPTVSGGTEGIIGITTPFIWVNDVTSRYLLFAVVVWVVALAICVYSLFLTNSPYARLLKSIRDDQEASANLGKRVTFFKTQVLVLGSAFAGIAGVLYTYYSGAVQADGFIPAITFIVWVMVILGGSGSIKGSLIGALVVTSIDQGTIVLNGFVVGSAILGGFNFSYVRYILYALIVIVVLLYRPKGLSAEQPVKTVGWKTLESEGQANK